MNIETNQGMTSNWLTETYKLQLVTIDYGPGITPRKEYTIKNFDKNGKELGDIFGKGNKQDTISHIDDLAKRINNHNNHTCAIHIRGPIILEQNVEYIKRINQSRHKRTLKSRNYRGHQK